MSKFLSIVEANLPDENIDDLTKGKRQLVDALRKCFESSRVADKLSVDSDMGKNLKLMHAGKAYTLELKSVEEAKEEDGEGDISIVKAYSDSDRESADLMGQMGRLLPKAKAGVKNLIKVASTSSV